MEVKLKVKMVDFDIVLKQGSKGINSSEILERCYNYDDDIKICKDKENNIIKAIDLNMMKHTIIEDNKVYYIMSIYSEMMV